jgi:ethanolamine utilization protein EutQ (cupin superfamily)
VDAQEREMTGPKLFRVAEIKREFTPRGSSTHVFVDDKDKASMAAGVVYFKDSNIDFKLWYDEVMFCLSVEEKFEIVVDGVENDMKPGDMMWLPAGTSLIWRSKGTSAAIFAVTPPDWAARRPT